MHLQPLTLLHRACSLSSLGATEEMFALGQTLHIVERVFFFSFFFRQEETFCRLATGPRRTPGPPCIDSSTYNTCKHSVQQRLFWAPLWCLMAPLIQQKWFRIIFLAFQLYRRQRPLCMLSSPSSSCPSQTRERLFWRERKVMDGTGTMLNSLYYSSSPHLLRRKPRRLFSGSKRLKLRLKKTKSYG